MFLHYFDDISLKSNRRNKTVVRDFIKIDIKWIPAGKCGPCSAHLDVEKYPELRPLNDADDPTPFLLDAPPIPVNPVEMKCIIPSAIGDQTPASTTDRSARDLLVRLLEPNPQKRLRSIYTLERIAFYKDYSFDDVRNKKISPLMLMSVADSSEAKGQL